MEAPDWWVPTTASGPLRRRNPGGAVKAIRKTGWANARPRDESLFGGIAVDHAVDLLEVNVAGTLAAEFGLGRGGGLPHPVGGARMAREEAPRRPLAAKAGLLACELGFGAHRLEKARHRYRVEAAAAQIAHTQKIGLQLL